MGNTQCKSISNSKIPFELIERRLEKGTSEVEKRIFSEYMAFKKSFTKKKAASQDKCPITKDHKIISSFKDVEKKKATFLKWFQVITQMSPDIFEEKSSKNLEELLTDNFLAFQKEKPKIFCDLVANGPPNSIRSLMWLISLNIHNKDSHLYEALLNEDIDPKTDEQIKKDLNRTYFQNEDFSEEKIKKLHNILRVFALQDKEIGYCQGMNFIAKFILLVTEYNEIDSFYLISYLFGEIRGYFTDNFPLLKFNLFIFNYFFKKLYPKLYGHFQALEIPDELWVGKWMQTLFTICLPFDVTCRVWDSLFVYGIDFIIPLSLSMVSFMEKDLLKFKDSSDVIEYFKETLFPKTQDTYVTKNYDDFILSIDKIISYGRHIYKSMNKEAINHLKQEFEEKYNTSLEQITKRYDMELLIHLTKSISSSQSSTDLSVSNKDNNIPHFENNEKIDEIDEIENCDEYESEEEMNTKKIPLHVIDTFLEKTNTFTE